MKIKRIKNISEDNARRRKMSNNLKGNPVEGFAEKSREAAVEGIVLLKNEGNVLPLTEDDKISVFGRPMIEYYRSGTGSGGAVNVEYTTNILDGFENSNLNFNKTIVEDYKEWLKDHPFDNGGGGWACEPWFQKDMEITADYAKKQAESTNKAVYIIGRTAGEDKDNANWVGSYLLTDEEKENLKNITEAFEDVCVVLNVSNIIDLKWIDEEQFKGHIKSVIIVWQGGMEGGNAVAEALSGKATPSGKLPDTIAYNIEDYPANDNFGNELTNLYKEDIYVGYRYFETIPGADKKVVYPFGYGLSYTTFKWELERVDEAEDGTLIVRAEVTNTGNHEGKEVLQLYGSAPAGVIDKPAKILLSYAKTKLLQPGENQLVTLVGNVNDLASYDDLGVLHKSAYVMEQGEYHFYLGNSVRNIEELGFIHTEESTRVAEQLTECLAPTSLPKRMRADGSFEELPVRPAHDPDSEGLLTKKEKEAIDGVAPDVRFSKGEHLWNNNERRMQFEQVAEGSVTLDEFVAQLSDEELAHLLGGQPNTGVANTFGFGNLPECGIPNFMTADGPAGLRILPECGVCTTAWPCATLLACTWNPEIVYEVGAAGAKEVKENNIAVWLTPAINIHRTPMCGRNFEYYSEDPYLVAKQAGAMVRGIQSQHIAATVKHFALNNKETNRKDSNSRVSERAARQIYLKTFERIVKEAKPWCIMSSYNIVNDYRASENHDLLEKLLRDEWGFEGVVMTDWWTFGEHCKEVNAGNDVKMAAGNPDNLLKALEKGLLKRETMECSVKRLLGVLLKID